MHVDDDIFFLFRLSWGIQQMPVTNVYLLIFGVPWPGGLFRALAFGTVRRLAPAAWKSSYWFLLAQNAVVLVTQRLLRNGQGKRADATSNSIQRVQFLGT